MGINTDNFGIHISGSSQINLGWSNPVARPSIYIALIPKEMDLNVYGDAFASVYASQKLYIRVAGQGWVVYCGNPPFLNQSIFGKGTVETGSNNYIVIRVVLKGKHTTVFKTSVLVF